MREVEEYIIGLDGHQKAIVSYFHQLLSNEYELIGKIRYKIPFYYRKSWICYLNPVKNGGIELAFIRANELSNDNGLLDFKGRRQVASVEIVDLSELPIQSIHETIKESLLLDDLVKYSVRKGRTKHPTDE